MDGGGSICLYCGHVTWFQVFNQPGCTISITRTISYKHFKASVSTVVHLYIYMECINLVSFQSSRLFTLLNTQYRTYPIVYLEVILKNEKYKISHKNTHKRRRLSNLCLCVSLRNDISIVSVSLTVAALSAISLLMRCFIAFCCTIALCLYGWHGCWPEWFTCY